MVVWGFPPTCARAVLTHPDLLSFVLFYFTFQQFRMVVSRRDCQKAEVCECVSHMYFTFSQDIGAIWFAPCCGPNKRCEIFMNMTTSPCNLVKFPIQKPFCHSFCCKKQQGHEATKKSCDTNRIDTFPRSLLMKLSALNQITSNVLRT